MTSLNYSCRKFIYLRHCVLNMPRSAIHLYTKHGSTPILLHRKNNCDVQLAKQDTNKK